MKVRSLRIFSETQDLRSFWSIEQLIRLLNEDLRKITRRKYSLYDSEECK